MKTKSPKKKKTNASRTAKAVGSSRLVMPDTDKWVREDHYHCPCGGTFKFTHRNPWNIRSGVTAYGTCRCGKQMIESEYGGTVIRSRFSQWARRVTKRITALFA